MFVDVHAHLTDSKYVDGVKPIVDNFKSVGVGLVISSGYDIISSQKSKDLADIYDCVYFSAGVHPDEAKTLDNQVIDQLIALLSHKKCVAVGEIGFDFYWNKSTEEEQIFAFEKQMEIADHFGLPFVVHSRDASAKTVKFLTDRKSLIKHGFLMHCYSESAETAKIYQNLGAYFSFGGVITFKNAKKDEIIKVIDRDRLLTETDSPYLAPHPFRGQINEPSKIPLIANKMAEILNLEEREIKEVLRENARRLFGV
ncbi:MAG: TatD family deoxyribonuclease [Clostridiales bacterium]|nr:TatD family deoxyribonuclease [Clostridiales bacterium]